jgi:hypothetical protein
MGFNRVGITLMVLFTLVSISSSWADSSSTDSQAWVQETDSSLKFTYLEAVIYVKIKNNNDHPEFFKISKQYSAEGALDPSINWSLIWTSPPAFKMAKYINEGGDYGWEIQPGETKEVSFKLVSNSPPYPYYIRRTPEMNNTFWPIINEPGLTATWFFPNEIEYLNPNLDLQVWRGKFCFWLKDVDTKSPRVEGIVRAPIVPVDSDLIASNPQAFTDDEVPWADTAAWDVTLYPGQSKHYSYTYQWPISSSSGSSGVSASSISFPTTSAANNTTSVPTPSTGVPYGLFVVGVIIIASGVTYAKFFR